LCTETVTVCSRCNLRLEWRATGAVDSAIVDFCHGKKTVNSAIESGVFRHNAVMAEKPVDHGGITDRNLCCIDCLNGDKRKYRNGYNGYHEYGKNILQRGPGGVMAESTVYSGVM